MKKYIYSLFAAAALLLGTASCSSEDELVPSGSNEGVEVSFQLALSDAASSRGLNNDPTDDVYGRGTKVNNVIAAVYSNGAEIESLRKKTNSINADLTCNVTFRLIEGQTYDFVFWAEKTGTGFYNTDDLTAIKVSYAGNANDEDRDAFTAVRKGLVVKNGGMSEKIVLTRPFAQLNIASTDEDHEVAEAAGFGCNDLKSKVTIKGVYDTYNAFTEALADSRVDIDFTAAAVPGAAGEVLKNVQGKNDPEGKDYKGYLSMNYFLASKDQSQTLDVTAKFESENSNVPVEISVPHVPVQRNYRTNIIGNILTEQAVFNIIIDPNFKTPDYVVGWDGKTITPATENGNTYEVSSPSQLAWIAQQVNTGAESFAGKTVMLMENINLGNAAWTPIGTATYPFKGTFDGKKNDTENYHVDAFNVSTTEAAGLFGILNGTVQNLTIESASVIGGVNGAGIVAGQIFNYGTIDNVTVTDSNVEGNHYVAGIAGYVYGSITNCTVENVTVTATPNAVSRALTYDNGDKVGGIVGLHAFDATDTEVKGNTVKNVTLKGYRDIGGIAGAADGSRVTENTVENVNIIWDQKNFFYEDKDENTGEIVGRLDGTTLGGNNTASNVTIAVVTSDVNVEGLSKSEDGVYLISSAEALQWIAEQVNNSEQDYPFRNETLKLTTDINLGGMEWTPIGNGINNNDQYNGHAFCGHFDGNGKTISNYVVNKEYGAGLFGFVGFGSIKNLTVSNVTVNGHHYAGALAGHVQNPGTSVIEEKTTIIENCHAKNVTITLTPDANNDNGNHAGGLIAYTVRTKVTGCTVDNAVVSAYRDCGGLIGGAMAGSIVEDNIVTNSIITSDQTPEYYVEGIAPNAGKVAGRTAAAVDLTNNTAGDDVIARVLVNTSQDLLNLIKDESIKVITLADNISVGSTQLAIDKPITIDLNGKILTSANNWGGITLKNGASIKNGIINHTGNTAAIKAFQVEAIEDVTINVTPTDGKEKGGIVVQEGANTYVKSIKNVTITGATNGIETYRCGTISEERPYAIGSMTNVTIDATDTGISLSAPVGTVKDCKIEGDKIGIHAYLYGPYSVSMDLVNCSVTGETGIYAHDEVHSNPGTLAITYDGTTIINGGIVQEFQEEVKDRVSIKQK